MKQNKLPKTFCYLVYCNPDPAMVYATFKSKQQAVRYAIELIRWRRHTATANSLEFGYYHFHPYVGKCNTIEHVKASKNSDNLWMTETVFTACLKCRGGYDDACNVQVKRMPLQ
jgi:hypothetical protein